MGNKSCCGTKQKGPRGKGVLETMNRRKDLGVAGRPAHRPRGEIFKQEEMVYTDFIGMAKMAFEDEDLFIQKTKDNKVYDLSKYVGFEVIRDRLNYFILKSGRQIHSTADWNPLTFALVYEKEKLLKYILDEVNFNMPQMLAIGLPQTSVSNNRDWSESELIIG